MVPLARRNLLENRLRLALSVGGVALAVMLVLLLQGFLTGMYRQTTVYVDNAPATHYVTQPGVGTFQGSSSVIPLETVSRVAAVQGVQNVFPVVLEYAVLDIHQEKVTTLLLGYDPERGGEPWELVGGRALAGSGEVVLDEVLPPRFQGRRSP